MLRDTFKKYGDNFFLMAVISSFRIYRREDQTGKLTGYEIIKPIMIQGELCLPASSFWGIYGWSCTDELHVVLKMDELLKKEAAKS